jgi:signal transduction histidine kinase
LGDYVKFLTGIDFLWAMALSMAASNKPELLSIRRILLYIEWTVITSTLIVVILNGWTEDSFVSQIVTYACLSTCVGLSLFFPVDRPLWQRRAYVGLEILTLLPTRVLTGWNLELLLFLFLAKSCFLLNRKDVIITVIAAGIAWQLGVAWYISEIPSQSLREKAVQYLKHPEKFKQQSLVARVINDSASMIAAGTFVVWFGFSLRSEQESRQRAIALTQQMEVLAATLERTRIARDIHDSLGHTLTTLNVQLELSQRAYKDNPEQALQALNTAQTLANQSLMEVRSALRTMHEKTFDLNQALLTLTEQVQQGQSFQIQVQTNLPQLPPQIGYQLYRIIQEGLTNIQKHALATSVYLGGTINDHHLVLELVDDGQGFNPHVDHAGFGLRGMQERAMLLRGQFNLESTLGRGTRIYITIPL